MDLEQEELGIGLFLSQKYERLCIPSMNRLLLRLHKYWIVFCYFYILDLDTFKKQYAILV